MKKAGVNICEETSDKAFERPKNAITRTFLLTVSDYSKMFGGIMDALCNNRDLSVLLQCPSR